MSHYALLVSGFFLCFSALIIKTSPNWPSFVFFRLIPAAIGIWALWEAARLFA